MGKSNTRREHGLAHVVEKVHWANVEEANMQLRSLVIMQGTSMFAREVAETSLVSCQLDTCHRRHATHSLQPTTCHLMLLCPTIWVKTSSLFATLLAL